MDGETDTRESGNGEESTELETYRSVAFETVGLEVGAAGERVGTLSHQLQNGLLDGEAPTAEEVRELKKEIDRLELAADRLDELAE